MFGVQTQTLGEVARDVAIEGAIGAGGEVLGAAVCWRWAWNCWRW